MAKAKTYQLEHGGYCWGDDSCSVCGQKNGSPYRIFYYPTFMNGDAEWIADFCEKHKKEAEEYLKVTRKDQ